MLDNITLTWLTNTGVSSARLYHENAFGFFDAKGVSVPAAVTVFPKELYQAPRSWAERAYPNLIYFERGRSRRALRGLAGAATERGIDYPVVVDNDFAIWRAFANQCWPALYFVDADGVVTDEHFGEGRYEQSERTIQRLLGVDASRIARTGVTRARTGIASRPGGRVRGSRRC